MAESAPSDAEREDGPPLGPRPDLDDSEVAAMLDECAGERASWVQLTWLLSERAAVPMMRDESETVTALGAALDAVYYKVTFDEDGSRRVQLRPANEAAGSGWPPHVVRAGDERLRVWGVLAQAVNDDAVLARLRHLLFQAKVQPIRDHAIAAVDAYVRAAQGEWEASDSLTWAYAAFRLASAMRDKVRAEAAGFCVRDVIERSMREGKPGIATRGARLLAGSRGLPFAFMDLADRLLPDLDGALADQVYAAALRDAKPGDRADLWRSRIRRGLLDAHASSDALVRTSKLSRVLHLADRSGIAELRRDVAAQLQRAGQQRPQMMDMSTVTRWEPGQLDSEADEMIGDDGLGQGLARWARTGPCTGNAAANRRMTEDLLAGSMLWALLPKQVLDENHLPRFSAPTEDERFEMELVENEARSVAMAQPLLATALERVGARYGLPNLSSLYGFLRTWPGLDDASAYMTASALLRFWTRDYDGAFYLATPLVERTFRYLVVSADEGVYQLQKNQRPGQFPGVAALLDPLARLYDLDEDWRRYYYVAVVHPTGLNLRNLAAHGLMGVVHRDVAALMLHLVLHLGTLRLR
ncbi:DUF4209 domain-containing protein [Cellulomonas humilata]|uniref:DUF4209 domain-containing protein n=1 Tax=Cellulomonas humilata TaxID=144055 RepID=A0A7Y6DZI8_9CELL|nr:DUF4209 domain-containing protein [Cellulomonas humilata]NUU19059.1 DUF4209 domain-containing protein [Cellulomonas humilata]